MSEPVLTDDIKALAEEFAKDFTKYQRENGGTVLPPVMAEIAEEWFYAGFLKSFAMAQTFLREKAA